MTKPSLLIRMWRLFKPGGNPLVRVSDRVEAVLMTCSVLIVLAGLPFAAALGSETYANRKQVSVEQLATRYPATATLLEDGPSIRVVNSRTVFFSRTATEAKWTLPDGTVREGAVMVGQGEKEGTTVDIWLDELGNPVGAPLTETAALVDSVAISIGLWLGMVFALGGTCWLARLVLDRARYARWQREWFSIEATRVR